MIHHVFSYTSCQYADKTFTAVGGHQNQVRIYAVGKMNNTLLFGVIEGDDIGVVVVLQVGLVDLQQRLIGTKHIVHCNKDLSLLPEQGSDKQLKPAALQQGETGIRKVKPDAGSNRLGRHFQKSQKTLGKRN